MGSVLAVVIDPSNFFAIIFDTVYQFQLSHYFTIKGSVMNTFLGDTSRTTMLTSQHTLGIAVACFVMLVAMNMPTGATAGEKLTIYSGRAERLIKPVLDDFTAKSGIQIELLSSGTAELVNRMKAEGDRSPADVFITNDAGSLEMARTAGLFRPLNMREARSL